MVLRVPVLVCLPSILLLNAASIRQDQLTQVFRPWRAEDTPLVPLRGQPGKVAHMIQVGMGEDHSMEATGQNWKFVPVSETELLQPLEQAAVEQYPLSIVFEEVLGTGDGAGGTKKCEFGHVTNDDIRVFLDLLRECRLRSGIRAVLLCPTWESGLLSLRSR